jgi:hypothetical protein
MELRGDGELRTLKLEYKVQQSASMQSNEVLLFTSSSHKVLKDTVRSLVCFFFEVVNT